MKSIILKWIQTISGFIDSEFEYTLDNVLYTVSSLPIQVILNDTFATTVSWYVL